MNMMQDEIPIRKQINESHNYNMHKYKCAGEILTDNFNMLKSDIVVDANIIELCNKYDAKIMKELENIFIDYTRGIAFPTCISINNQAGYNSPLNNDNKTIKIGDLVKIEMGIHIDEFPIIVGDTIMVGDANEKQDKVIKCITNIKKDLKTYIKIDKNSKDLTDYVRDIVQKHNCNLLTCHEDIIHCPGMFSCQVSQGVIDGRNIDGDIFEKHEAIFMGRDRGEFIIDNFDFQKNQVFVIDLAVSSGNGYVNIKDNATVYKSNPDFFYSLKMKGSKETLNILKNNGGRFPQSIRNLDIKNYGLRECVDNGIVETYPVLYEKEGEYICNFKFTIILRKGNKKKKNKNIYFNF